MIADLAEVERYLHRHIPISKEMAVGLVSLDAAGVRLRAPIAPNINHRSTVFGGSASALAILSAWALVHFRLHESDIDGRVVIQRNAVEYLRPIDDDFEAFCPAPPAAVWDRFVDAVARRGLGRIELAASLEVRGETAATFSGTYVALRPDRPG